MMGELICHLFGDYVLQNHAMAIRKRSSWRYAALHVAFYVLPFLLLTRSLPVLAVIAGTHLVIDRFGLARHWTEFWGVGSEGCVMPFVHRILGLAPTEPMESAPPFLAVWLIIIVDNTWHLAINHLALVFLA